MRCEWEYRNPGPSIQDGRAREGLGSVICAREREREKKQAREGGREGRGGRERREGERGREKETEQKLTVRMTVTALENDGDSFKAEAGRQGSHP